MDAIFAAPPPLPKKTSLGANEWRHLAFRPLAFFRLLNNIADFGASRQLIVDWSKEVVYLNFDVSVSGV